MYSAYLFLFQNTIEDVGNKTQVRADNTIPVGNYSLDVYKCRNAEVISLLGRCDNVNDCFDQSDEENCKDTAGILEK